MPPGEKDNDCGVGIGRTRFGLSEANAEKTAEEMLSESVIGKVVIIMPGMVRIPHHS